MHFASDNAGPAHPRVMDALLAVNAGHAMPYGADAAMDVVRARIRDLFEAPEAAVYLVATGTAANALLLATMGQPWETVFCADVAHVAHDECGAPEFFGAGAKLTPVPTVEARMTPAALRAAIESTAHRVVHGVQRGPVTLTQITERGTLYSLDEIAALTAVARDHGLPVHMDGARFANAVAALGCTPAQMTWRAGVHTLSFGGTKNGLLGVEAAVIFDPAQAWEFELRRKRAAHLFSKHRYLSAQMAAYLTDGLWLEMASAANAACARLADALRAVPDVRIDFPPQGNMIYAAWPRAAHRRLMAAGAQYYMMGAVDGPDDGMVPARLVCDWTADPADTDRFIDALRG
jgi:threonine aldolase